MAGIAATQEAVMTMITYLHVRARSAASCEGRLIAGNLDWPCLLGRTGRRHRKREGDDASPVGIWGLEELFYRSDRWPRPRTALKVRPISRSLGWCDATGNRSYNRLVTLPFVAGHEPLWREDVAYDHLVVLSHNRRPRIQGGGSAIFLHVARPGAGHTAGCIALRPRHMAGLLGRIGRGTRLVIWPPDGMTPYVFRRLPSRPGCG
jgi:L,D-peptidoglycan transpeptidase YkuD (ErfK/YbiS/YcfS/YnhG family)